MPAARLQRPGGGDELGEASRNRGVAMQLLGTPLLLVVAFGSGGIAFEIVVAFESGLPLLEAGNDAGGQAHRRPVPGGCHTNGGSGQPGGDVVTGEIVVGEGESLSSEQPRSDVSAVRIDSRTRGCRRRRASPISRAYGCGCRTARRYGRAVCRDGRHRPRDGGPWRTSSSASETLSA